MEEFEREIRKESPVCFLFITPYADTYKAENVSHNFSKNA